MAILPAAAPLSLCAFPTNWSPIEQQHSSTSSGSDPSNLGHWRDRAAIRFHPPAKRTSPAKPPGGPPGRPLGLEPGGGCRHPYRGSPLTCQHPTATACRRHHQHLGLARECGRSRLAGMGPRPPWALASLEHQGHRLPTRMLRPPTALAPSKATAAARSRAITRLRGATERTRAPP